MLFNRHDEVHVRELIMVFFFKFILAKEIQKDPQEVIFLETC